MESGRTFIACFNITILYKDKNTKFDISVFIDALVYVEGVR